MREVAVKAIRTTRYRSGKRELHCVFFTDFEKMTVDKRDITNLIAEVKATIWHLRETIPVRELAATHRLEEMHCLLMLEEYKAWKREVGFYCIETAADIGCTALSHQPRFRTFLLQKYI